MTRRFLIETAALVLGLIALAPLPAAADRQERGDDRGEHENTRVQPLFGLTLPAQGPFPADRFTVADPAQNTCERINLPKPACPSADQWKPGDSWECVEVDLLNELDGFSVTPRVAIPFSGPIDLSTANSTTIFFVSLGSSLRSGAPDCLAPRSNDDGEDDDERRIGAPPRSGWVVGINELVWEPTTNTLYARPDERLEEHTRHALIVTRGVRDPSGHAIAPSDAFDRFRSGEGDDRTRSADPSLATYRRSLRRGLALARLAGVKTKDVAVASVFTTVSVAASMQKLREPIVSAPPPAPIQFVLTDEEEPGVDAAHHTRTVFDLAKITGMTWNRHIKPDPTATGALSPASLATRLASVRIVPGVSQIAFGRYMSPNFLGADYTMPPVASFSGVANVDPSKNFSRITVAVFIPDEKVAGPKPVHGWPVVLFGHGSADSLWGSPFNVAAHMAAHGLATVAINEAGNGYGPASTVTITTGKPSVTFPGGGRSADINGDGQIGANEGHMVVAPKTILLSRHSLRQSATDMMQLVREIQVGVDVDGDGVVDLDASHIYYAGTSSGSAVGVLMFAIEPAVRAGAFIGATGRPAPWLSPVSRSAVGQLLTNHVPTLINAPGVSVFHGAAVPGDPKLQFNENIPERDQAPLVNDVAGAMAIQDLFERVDWISSNSTIGSFAPYLRHAPLPGVPARPFLFLESRGDQQVVNPGTAYTVRSGVFPDRVMLYHHDYLDQDKGNGSAYFLFAGKQLPTDWKDPNKGFPDPHSFFIRTDSSSPKTSKPGEPDAYMMQPIALAAQKQVATFFQSDGTKIIDPDGAGPLFEAPAARIWADYGFVVP